MPRQADRFALYGLENEEDDTTQETIDRPHSAGGLSSRASAAMREDLPALRTVLNQSGARMEDYMYMLSPDGYGPDGIGDMLKKMNIKSNPNTPGLHTGTSMQKESPEAPNAATASTFGRHACPGVHTPRNDGALGDRLPESSAQFASGVRAKLAEVLPMLVAGIPLGDERENIYISEFGCLNSRSVYLFQVAIELFLRRLYPQDQNDDTLGNTLNRPDMNMESNGVSFVTIHEDSPNADFRSFVRMLNTAPESHLNPMWQSSRCISLQNSVFPVYASRPFGSRIVPPSTLHLGFSLMNLHWTHTPNTMDVSLATTAHAELHMFLTARAVEFRKGGVFVVAFIARTSQRDAVAKEALPVLTDQLTDPPSSAIHSPRQEVPAMTPEGSSTDSYTSSRSSSQADAGSDIWKTLTEMLVPCLQRLVSCGMLKSDVARHMLTLPLHPRTPAQTRRVLKQLSHLWAVEWSCGLGLDEGGEGAPKSTPEPLCLPHPACAAFQAGVLHPAALTEQLIYLLKNLYESHFRMILRERGKLSKGAVEFVLDSLWDVAHSRILDQCMLDKNVSPLSNLELADEALDSPPITKPMPPPPPPPPPPLTNAKEKQRAQEIERVKSPLKRVGELPNNSGSNTPRSSVSVSSVDDDRSRRVSLSVQMHPHSFASKLAMHEQDAPQEKAAVRDMAAVNVFQPKGIVRDRTAAFLQRREAFRRHVELDEQRLERRLEKMALLYAEPEKFEAAPSISLLGILQAPRALEKQRLRSIVAQHEQSIVKWQDDHAAPNLSYRRQSPAAAKEYDERELHAFRMCYDCHTILMRMQYRTASARPTPLITLYGALVAQQKKIEEALPDFHEMILGLQYVDADRKNDAEGMLASTVHDSLELQHDAAQARKELLQGFAQYDKLAKQIRDLEHRSHAEAQTGSDRAAVSKQIRILQEQDHLLTTYLVEAAKTRSLDDIAVLKANKSEVRSEIARLQRLQIP
ncbi:hypothetical protein MCUN1_003786 [Malassezia cuniculi]|uniref:Rabenosyn Rab binding domain-containing protein n=1 Tax=Malassezia cuniculi TaxID=948313 RepID=A0AAF0EU69_9BASI|nr:hypothetical protein MCUN1_003786 [Malassezia cuniculi]